MGPEPGPLDVPPLTLVVAVAENDVIGSRGAMPWHLPADLAHFRRVTTGHPVLMGRPTYEAIGRPLSQRRNLVLTRRPGFEAPGCEVHHSLASVWRAVAGERTFVIGGAEVFGETGSLADELHLTRVHGRPEGDTLLRLDLSGWALESSRTEPADDRNAYSCTYFRYLRPR